MMCGTISYENVRKIDLSSIQRIFCLPYDELI